MEFNVVTKRIFGTIRAFNRLDAEYVMPSLLVPELVLQRSNGFTLLRLADKYDGPTVADSYADGSDIISYVSINSVDNEDGLTYSDKLRFADRPSRAKFVLDAGDILVSNVRPNRGAVSLITERNAGSLASSGFTLIRVPACSHIPKEFIFAFIKTKYGRDQLIRRNRGSMYPAVVSDDIFDMWIPEPPSGFIEHIVEEVRHGLSLQDQFLCLNHDQQETIATFLNPLGSPPSPLETKLNGIDYTVIRTNDCFREGGPRRLDAEFFRSEYAAFDRRCRSFGPTFLLGDFYELSPGSGLAAGDQTIPFIKQGILTNAGINWSAVSYETDSSSNPTNVAAAVVGDILLACTAHEIYYVGRKVDYVRDMPTDISIANAVVPDIIIIRPLPQKPNYIAGSYVATFLRCQTGLHQVQRCIRGLRGGHVYKNDLAKYVRVPIPPQDWLKDFEHCAEKAESLRLAAKSRLVSAFSAVEAWAASIIISNGTPLTPDSD